MTAEPQTLARSSGPLRLVVRGLLTLQFGAAGLFALLVLYGSLPCRDEMDRFYVIYSGVLLGLAAAAYLLLWAGRAWSMWLLALVNLLLPAAFSSFLLVPFLNEIDVALRWPVLGLMSGGRFAEQDVRLGAALIAWMLAAIVVSILTIAARRPRQEQQPSA